MEISDNVVAIIAIIVAVGVPVVMGLLVAIKVTAQKHKENMAMIEQGIMPVKEDETESKRAKLFRNAFSLMGVGAGLAIGFGISKAMHIEEDKAIFVLAASILICLGIAFFAYHKLSSKQTETED